MRRKMLLAAVNAKYIHSNLAVYSLTAYGKAKGIDTELAEYTINHQQESVLRDIFERQPDVIGFSCYIWNMDFIRELAEELHKVLPHVPIWMGGPEVSWNPEEYLQKMPFVTGIMIGEGEQTWCELAEQYGYDQVSLDMVSGICFRTESGEIRRNPCRKLLNMDDLVFPYNDLSQYENRIIYYESGRGCPFSCSYCLSSIERKLRFRSLPLVYKELEIFLREKVKQVKFVDRTFNCRHEHAYAIWKYIYEHDNGITNFHFEVSADLLKEEDFLLFEQMRPGLIQLEIGVQTTNPLTIKAIGRTMDLDKVNQYTARVRAGRNIHQHLDLIAGLPWEDLESFEKSFNDVYEMKPDQLQLGFLKVLHGTRMETEAQQHGLVYRTHPVYEVLYTKWLSFSDVLQLKNVEETVEEYYNSGQFLMTLSYVVPFFENPFRFYLELGSFLRENGYREGSQNRAGRYMALRHFLRESEKADCSLDLIDELLSFDFCLREKLNRVPEFIPDQEPYKKLVSDFFAQEIHEGRWFGEEALNSSYRQLRGHCQPLVFQHNIHVLNEEGTLAESSGAVKREDNKEKIEAENITREESGNEIKEENRKEIMGAVEKTGPWLAVFDYEKRNVMNHNAYVHWIPIQEKV